MENIIINDLKLMEIDEIEESIFWCRFGRIDESRTTVNDATKLARITKSATATVSIEFINCGTNTHWIGEKKPEWLKSVVLALQAKSVSEVKDFLNGLSNSRK